MENQKDQEAYINEIWKQIMENHAMILILNREMARRFKEQADLFGLLQEAYKQKGDSDE